MEPKVDSDIDLKTLTDEVLAKIDIHGDQRRVLFDLLVHTGRFAFSKGFGQLQISTLCSILAEVVNTDVQNWPRGANTSFEDFQERLLQNSSERIPKSRGIFSPVQAVTAVDFVLRVYYSRFQLYKHSVASVPDPLLSRAGLAQDNVAGVETVLPMPRLSEAILVESFHR